MIDQTFKFLKEQLNTNLSQGGVDPVGAPEEEQDTVVYIAGDKMEPLTFAADAVSMLLVNIEQEKTMRRAEPYRGLRADGSIGAVSPELRLELCILFAAHFRQYETGLKTLSGIVHFFQQNPIFSDNAQLPEGIGRLDVELLSLPMTQQNDIWALLRATYRPSLLYRVRLITFSDPSPVGMKTVNKDGVEINLKQNNHPPTEGI